VRKDHKLIKSTDNNDRFDRYICKSCHQYVYEATTHDTFVESIPQIHSEYEVIEAFQKDIDEEESLQLMCSEAQRLFSR